MHLCSTIVWGTLQGDLEMKLDHKCKDCTCEHGTHVWDECTECLNNKELLHEWQGHLQIRPKILAIQA